MMNALNASFSLPSVLRLGRRAVLFLFIGILLAGCDLFEIDDRPDPNGPSVEGVIGEVTRDKISNLAVGVESGMRIDMNLYLTDVGVVGREYYRFSASDPRFTSELLGESNATLNNNTFYVTRPWAARYRSVRNANILLEALEQASEGVVTEAEARAAQGYAKTLKAYQKLLNLNLTYQNGIRVDVADDENLGSLVGYPAALQAIRAELDDGFSDLNNGGEAFPFGLSDGFAGFNAPATFATFNRALAARVALYQKDYPAVLNLLDESFIDENGDLTEGVYHSFSTATGDLINPFFINPQETGDLIAAHPSYADDIRAGDNRDDKVVARETPFSSTGLFSEEGFFVYKSQTAPIPIIRNAELLLIRAEAKLFSGDAPGAIDDLNVIRNAAGLGDYSGATDAASVQDELLYQRRYELYGEGHRWVDVRRILGESDASNCPSSAQPSADGQAQSTCLNEFLPIDRAEDDVWLQFPVPASEFGADTSG